MVIIVGHQPCLLDWLGVRLRIIPVVASGQKRQDGGHAYQSQQFAHIPQVLVSRYKYTVINSNLQDVIKQMQG